jgi:hypothetical protein
LTSPRLTRAQWGAAPVPAGRPTRVDTMAGTALHYVGGSLGTVRHDRCAEILRSIQRTHQAGEYYDIAYNEAACQHGTRYELRGYHVQPGANGTATANRTHYAILALVGAGDALPLAMLDALEDAFDAYRARAGAGVKVTGHRDHIATSCPGEPLYTLVRRGTFSPKPPPTPPVTITEENDEMLVRVTDRTPAPVYVTDGLTRRWLPTPAARDDYVRARSLSKLPPLPEIPCPTEARALAAFGPVVGKVPFA